MTPHDSFDGAGRPPPSTDPIERLWVMRNTVLQMDDDTIARQLPHLVEEVAERSTDDVKTLQFVVGVSISRNETLLDYSLDRVVDHGQGDPRLETLKPPVSDEHPYLTFPFPPDPTFDAETLRGALLASLDRQLAHHGWPSPEVADADGEDADSEGSWFAELRRQLRGPS